MLNWTKIIVANDTSLLQKKDSNEIMSQQMTFKQHEITTQ